jgi:AbrB family looped-hinge helix DNA binding protein
VLPKPVREALDLHTGETLLFLVDGDTVLLRPRPASFAATLRGLHREVWAEVDLDTWLDQERDQWA